MIMNKVLLTTFITLAVIAFLSSGTDAMAHRSHHVAKRAAGNSSVVSSSVISGKEIPCETNFNQNQSNPS